jgi:ribosomal protein S18 acetylase RimI-like enzyme
MVPRPDVGTFAEPGAYLKKLARQPTLGYCLQMNYRVVPMADVYIERFHETLDVVARERIYLGMLEAPPLDELRAYIQKSIRDGNPRYLALDGECVIGWCDISSLNRTVFAHSGLLGMGVLDGYREQGIGKALMTATLDAAKAAGLTRVELTVREHNQRALKLYEKMGFVIEGVKRRGVRLDGQYEDLICMAKLFE